MAEATFHFPRRFRWGTATSAHQVEGNNNKNTWWVWEQQEGHILRGHTSGLACDWWGGRWREDFDRAAESGQTVLRLSIEWSRVQPEPSAWNEDAIDRYRQMMRGLHSRDITPLVTLHHFTDPLWLSWEGGWEQDQSAAFVAYVEKMVTALKEYVDWWCTFNEPNVYAVMGYVLGVFPPGKRDIGAAFRVMTNLVRAHAAAYQAIHRLQPKSRVGVAHHYRGMEPKRGWLPLDRMAAGWQARTFNEFFPQALASGRLALPLRRLRIAPARGSQDFFGLNYYTEEQVAFDLRAPADLFSHRSLHPEAEQSPSNFIVHRPQGFYRAIEWAVGHGLPVVITENGVDDEEDRLRPRYLAEHVHQIWRAVNFNWPVLAYFHWTLVDNFEWDRGWTQPFGLWALERDTQARKKRPSADLYAQICQANALSSEMVARYAPEIFLEMFPNE